MPVLIFAMAFIFNWINGQYFGTIAPPYTPGWAIDIRLISGLGLFIAGIMLNWRSDQILIGLKDSTRSGYALPRKGMFRYVSCPNFLGEIIEWGGFALMAWSLPALSFFIWTAVNLLPRALNHHRWYLEQFEDYPPERKALIPFVL